MNITKIEISHHCALRRDILPGRRLHGLMLSALATAALLSAEVSTAADDTWTGDSVNSANWTDANNWNPGVPGEGDDLIFGASSRTDSTVDDFFDLSSITVTADAPAYTISLIPNTSLTLSDTGSLSDRTQGTASVQVRNFGDHLLRIAIFGAENADAGDKIGILIINAVTTQATESHAGGPSAASDEVANGPIELTNQGGTVSGARGGVTEFHGFASADNYTIINNPGEVMGALPGSTTFFDNSTAENATLVNNSYTAFNDDSTLGSATLTNNGSGSTTVFTGSSTAGTGTILTTRAADRVGGAHLQFSNLATAGSATITTNGGFELNDFSGSFTTFNGSSTAGSATLITNGGMVAGVAGAGTVFFDTAEGGTARAVTKAGGMFDISGLSAAGMGMGSIEGAGAYILGAKNLSVGGNDRSTTVSGVIEDNSGTGDTGGSLTKVGLGSLTLSGASTYTGGTTVSGSILFVDNSSGSGTGSGAVMVNSGGFLGGSGTIAGTATVNSGGTVSPGRSPGKLNINGNYIQKSGATLAVELGGAAAGSGFDQLAVDGSATLDGTLNVSLVNGFRPAVGATFQILTSQSASGNFTTVSSAGFTAHAQVSNSGVVLIIDTVKLVPIITSATSASATLDQAFSYQITATNSPTSFGAVGLPDGLSIDETSGIISGTPTELGSFPVAITLTNGAGVGAATLRVTISPEPAPFEIPAPLGNISTRLKVATGDNVLIGGLIVSGADPKQVIVRGIGPSLADFGINDVLADPVLELHKPDGTIVTNDNWQDTQEAEITAAGFAPGSDLESAILVTLDPGAYTAILRGKDDGTGVGLVEVYDLDQTVDSTLANISTRGLVETGDNVMIGGFIIGDGGGIVSTIVVRAIGPSLSDAGVANALQDPTLELHNGDGTIIAENDDWMDGPDQQTISDDGLAPANDAESALLATLAPGAYTAIVRGAGDTSGVALVEAYNLLP